jgi:NAD(P)-dependent dehydrogenase (short-subunit alcohol dehydrogenase family)
LSWNPRHLPSQSGKTFVVTGGNAGIGYFIAEQLAGAGARVVIAARNSERADAAIAAILRGNSRADLRFAELDLSCLNATRDTADALNSLGRIDGLIENAALVLPGTHTRSTTNDGFELTFGTNHLGHFALTALLYPTLAATPGSRVVTVGSLATRIARPRPDDLQSERSFSEFAAYAQSKHATQGFGFELDRRLRAAGSPVTALVAHPGGGQRGLTRFVPGVNEPTVLQRLRAAALIAGGGGNESAAWPIVRAATDPEAEGGQYWGRRFNVAGRPALSTPVASSHAEDYGRRLWERSEFWTGIRFAL